MAKTFTTLTVPQNSTRDGIAIHTWRTLVTSNINAQLANTANGGNVYANVANAYAQANAARLQANLSFNVANQAANTVAVYQDGFLTMAKCNVNFQNTVNLIWSTSPDVGPNYCNVSIDLSGSYSNNFIFRAVAMNPGWINCYGGAL